MRHPAASLVMSLHLTRISNVAVNWSPSIITIPQRSVFIIFTLRERRYGVGPGPYSSGDVVDGLRQCCCCCSFALLLMRVTSSIAPVIQSVRHHMAEEGRALARFVSSRDSLNKGLDISFYFIFLRLPYLFCFL